MMSSKTKKIIRWILLGMLTLQFLAAGIPKLLGSWDPMFEKWGYSASFALIIGAIEILAVVGLYPQRSRKWAAALIILIMVGAAYTHSLAGEYARILHNTIIVIFASGIILLDSKPAKS